LIEEQVVRAAMRGSRMNSLNGYALRGREVGTVGVLDCPACGLEHRIDASRAVASGVR
jgi:hypothetical protein